MSTKRNTNTKIAPKPFCKVCFDAGLPENKYTSHFVKSEPGPNGKTVCPTLLSQECRFCFGLGHTAKYCPVIAKNKKIEEKAQKDAARREVALKREEEQKAQKAAPVKKLSNIFEALNSSDSDEDVSKKKVSKLPLKRTETIRSQVTAQVMPVKQVVIQPKPLTREEEFPALPSKAKTVAAPVTVTGYASVAAKTPEEYQSEVYEQQLLEKSIKRQIKPLFTATKSAATKKIQAATYAQEDYYDSWDEDEEKEEVPSKPANKSLTSWADACYSSDEDW